MFKLFQRRETLPPGVMDRQANFQPAFLFFFSVVLAVATLVGVIVGVALILFGVKFPGVRSAAFLQLVSVIYIWAVVSTLIATRIYAFRVTSVGIEGRTFWSQPKFLAWEDMASARVVYMGPLRFARVFPRDGSSSLWVPLFIKKRAEFEEMVARFGTTSHPLFPHLR